MLKIHSLRLFVSAVLAFTLLALPAYAAHLPAGSPAKGLSAAADAPTLLGKEARQPVEDSTQLPYSAVCKLLITYQNGTHGEGTGFIYGDNLLATAGHVLYDQSAGRGGTPAEIEIIPGADGEERPFGSYMAIPGENSAFHTPSRWKTRQDWQYDYGVIQMEDDFDPEIGLLSLGHYEDYDREALQGATLSIFGYDAGSFHQLAAKGDVQKARAFDLLYRIGIMPGQSGAPVMDAENNVVAIQNYGVSLENGRCLPWNSGARLNKTAYCFLSGFWKQPGL